MMNRSLALMVGVGFVLVIGIYGWIMTQPRIIIVPHHDVVASQRTDFIHQLSRHRLITKKIILISTDHFGKNQHRILTTKQTLQLENSLSPNKLFGDLTASDDEAIRLDHGIMNLMPDIQLFFPKASIYPLLLGNQVRTSDLNRLVKSIESWCKLDCLVIASVDFSHYLPAAIAMTHDEFSIKALNNLDLDEIWKAEIDSPQALWITVSLASFWHALNWSLYNQTNSSLMINDPWYESTSHVFGWYQAGIPNIKSTLNSFTFINATASSHLNSLGDRLVYGADTIYEMGNEKLHNAPCNVTFANEAILTGWETKNDIYLGILPLKLNANGYSWDHQLSQLTLIQDCQKKIHLLPGTINQLN